MADTVNSPSAIIHRYAQIGAIILDASVNEQHDYQSKVSQYPVEDGSTVSDNIYNEPVKLTLKGVVTNHPFENGPNYYPTTSSPGGVSGPLESAFEDLMRIRNDRALVDIVTGLVNYTDMAMQSINFPRSYKESGALIFNATFVKVKKAISKTVPISKLKTNGVSNAKQSAPKVNQGAQTPKPIPDSVAYTGFSILGVVPK